MTSYEVRAAELWERQVWVTAAALGMGAAFFGMSFINHTLAAACFSAAYTLATSVYLMNKWRQLATFLAQNKTMTTGAHAEGVETMMRSYDDLIQIHAMTCRMMRAMTTLFVLVLAPFGSWALRYNAEYERLLTTSPWLQADPSWQERLVMTAVVLGMRLYFEGGRSVSCTWRVASVVGCTSVLLLYLSNAYTISMNWRLMGIKDPLLVVGCEVMCGVAAIFVSNELMGMVTMLWLLPEPTFSELYTGLRQCSDALLLSRQR